MEFKKPKSLVTDINPKPRAIYFDVSQMEFKKPKSTILQRFTNGI